MLDHAGIRAGINFRHGRGRPAFVKERGYGFIRLAVEWLCFYLDVRIVSAERREEP